MLLICLVRVLQTTVKSAAAPDQFKKNFILDRFKMGIFSNPSEVPIPGPPPKKETVRIELAGCGNLVKSLFCHPIDYLNAFLFSVAKLLVLLCCPVQHVMQVSGLLCRLQQKQLVEITM